MKDEEMKKSVKASLCITGDYPQNEILEALLMKDAVKLAEMQKRCAQLNTAYADFVEKVDGEDKDAREKAINTFVRPAR